MEFYQLDVNPLSYEPYEADNLCDCERAVRITFGSCDEAYMVVPVGAEDDDVETIIAARLRRRYHRVPDFRWEWCD